jgi:hypothetical protein
MNYFAINSELQLVRAIQLALRVKKINNIVRLECKKKNILSVIVHWHGGKKTTCR